MHLLKKLLKYSLILIILFVFLTTIAIQLLDINQYKGNIEQLVEEHTGLKLTINSDIILSYISGLKFNTGNIKLFNNKLLIADIKSISLGVDILSLLEGTPKVTTINLMVNSLNLIKNKKGLYNLLPQIKKSQQNVPQANKLAINNLLIEDIKLSIKQLQYHDKQEPLVLVLNDVKISLSLLPIIDHQELIVDDPRVFGNYSYSGDLVINNAQINEYTFTKLRLKFNNSKGDFFAKEVAFNLKQKTLKSQSPSLIIDAKGQLKIKLVYPSTNTKIEPVWTQPESILVKEFDFNLPLFELSDKKFQLQTKQSHLIVKEVAIYKNKKYLLDNFFLNFLKLDSKQIDLKWGENESVHLKEMDLNIRSILILQDGKLADFTSNSFLKNVSKKGKITLLINSATTSQQKLNDIQLALSGKDKKIYLSTLSLKILESTVTGSGYIDSSKELPSWMLKLHTERLNLKPVANLLNNSMKVEGYVMVDSSLAGTLNKSEFTVSTGRVHASGNDLQIHGLNIDEILSKFENSQSVGLLDVGAVALLGPAGILLSKGNDYRGLMTTLSKTGFSRIRQINSDISYTKGIATMDDVAFSSENHRLAVKGKINTLDDTFLEFEVATIDKQGCTVYKEIVSGSLDAPAVKKANVLIKTVVNPISSLLSKATKTLKIHCEKPFYTGVVISPLNKSAL